MFEEAQKQESPWIAQILRRRARVARINVEARTIQRRRAAKMARRSRSTRTRRRGKNQATPRLHPPAAVTRSDAS
ncbi:hypothetical protein F7725_020943 [Dissostichus mawsoni]|uniref:Uncharacterized protein n=1 Tax=Dissostichus mawsoni TaxID=36200 RepID=A0A7J5YEQ4_DISMA|nr:hypothetical protein F7725_020943 [Dissostichus mawsoni]